MKIILASGSPRRRQLLELAGIPHEVIVSNVDETVYGEPDEQVKELALRKAKAVLLMLENEDLGGRGNFKKFPLPPNPPQTLTFGGGSECEPIIIAADTLVYINGKVLGKPGSEIEAFEMLRALSGHLHMVYTGVAIVRGGYEHVFADATRVYFRALSDEEIWAYIATGEPFDKAGAYGVQERGAVLVDRVDGDFYTVVGLPIAKVVRALAVMGYDMWAANTGESAGASE